MNVATEPDPLIQVITWHRGNRYLLAETGYLKILADDPNHCEALFLLGSLYVEQSRYEEAVQLLRRSLIAYPDHADGWCLLGIVFQVRNLLEEASEAYQKALSLQPNHTTALKKMGLLHARWGHIAQGKNQLDVAINHYQTALFFFPESFEAHTNLGMIEAQNNRLCQAQSHYEQSLGTNPNAPETHNNLGACIKEQGLPDASLGHFLRATELRPSYHAAWSNYLFALNYLPNLSPEEIFEKHRAWGTMIQNGINLGQGAINCAPTGRKIKVGYLSPDFRNHSVAYFIEPILAHHNHDQFEIFCYADVPHPDNTSKRLQTLVPHWHDTHRLSDPELFSLISSHQLDILVDLAGHTAGNRLPVLARKVAPIQVSYLGYPNTTGLSSIDYRLTDALADPPGAEDFHTEQLIRLPNGFLCYQPPHNAPEVVSPPCLKNGFVTFGSCNTLAKTNSDVVSLWVEILKACPNSKLLLKNNSFADPLTLQHYQKLFSNHGIATHRLLFLPWLKQDHLTIYHQIDIALDPFPYNGTTTSCEALWMGVPVITLAGNRHAGRVGNSILHQIGWTEGVASNESQYVQIGIDCASHLSHLSTLRAGLRDRLKNSPLCDQNMICASIEDCYHHICSADIRYKLRS